MRLLRALVLVGILAALVWSRFPGAGPRRLSALWRRTASPSSATARAALVGTWRLVSILDSLPDGRTASWMGEHPRGLLMYDAAGHVAAQLMDPARPHFRGIGADAPDTAVRAADIGYYAYYGR